MAQYEIHLRDYIRIIRKRKFIVLFSTFCIGVLSFAFSYLQQPEPTYRSSASVKIEQSGTLTGLYLETVTWNSEDYLATQAEIIKSIPVMEKVAQRMGYIDSTLSSTEIRKNPKYVNLVLHLQSMVSTQQQGETNIIDIIVISKDPEESKRLANTIAQVYIEENIKEKNKRAHNALKFIEHQLSLVGKRLEEAEEAVRRYREKTNLITLEYEAQSVLEELREAEMKHNRYRREREELQLLISQIEKNETLPEAALSSFTLSGENSSLLELKRRLTELKLERDNLLIAFTERHPAVKEIDAQIEEIKKNIIKELKSLELSLRHKEKVQLAEVERLREKYRALPESGLELARLQRQVNINNEVYTLLASKRQEALIKNAEKIEEATLVKPALRGVRINPPTSPYTVAFVGLVVGCILGMIFAFIYESFDTSIGTIEDVERFLNLPVIGVLPYIDIEEMVERITQEGSINEDPEKVRKLRTHLISLFAPKSTIAESFRTLRTYLLYILHEKNIKSITITSSSPKEGKSTTAINLALSLSQIGKRILLVDADLRKPKIAHIFGLQKERGLSDIIMGTCPWREAVKTITDIMMGKLGLKNIALMPGIDNLHIITSGQIPLNPAELLNSHAMNDFINEVQNEYDIVLFDTTPVLPAADAAILSSKTQGVILIYQVGKVARGALKRTKDQLENLNSNIIGIVLNGLKAEISPDYSDFNYGDYYAYGDIATKEPEDQSFYKRWWHRFTSNLLGNGSKNKRKASKKSSYYSISRKKKPKLSTRSFIFFLVFIGILITSIIAGSFLLKSNSRNKLPNTPPQIKKEIYEQKVNPRKFVSNNYDLISSGSLYIDSLTPLVIELDSLDLPTAHLKLKELNKIGFHGFIDIKYSDNNRLTYSINLIGFINQNEIQRVYTWLKEKKFWPKINLCIKPYIITVLNNHDGLKIQKAKSILERKGFFPIILGKESLIPEYTIMVGMYKLKEEADLMKQILSFEGLNAAIIKLDEVETNNTWAQYESSHK